MSDHPRLGAAIPRLLIDRGIDMVFGIPGVHTVELYRGLDEPGIRHVTPRHEQGAGFMADGYARASGRPAACFLITGPGLLNAATAMAQALADSVPMLVISSTNPRPTLGRGEGRLHELRGQSLIGREVSALGLTVLTAEQLVPALDEACALFHAARPGPVHIEIPLDLLAEPYAPPARPPAPLPAPPAADAATLAEAARLIDGARRPVVILGGGAVRGAAAVRVLAEAIGAPVLSTLNARGILPAGHPLIAGGGLPFAPARDLIRDADMVLALGTEFGETDFEYYGEGPVEMRGRLIRVDIEARQLARNVIPDLAIVAEAGAFAAALAPLLTTRRRLADEARRVREAGLAANEPRIARHRPLVEMIWRVLPEAIIAGDSTAASYGAGLYAEPPAPRRLMSAATGFGTLGFALPAAIGAKLARPEAPVVVLIGDGGLHYTLPELATAAEAGAPVIICLWNDRRYGEIETYMARKQVRPLGVTLYPTDFAAAARAFGAEHRSASTLAEVEAALIEAAESPRATIIEMDAARFA